MFQQITDIQDNNFIAKEIKNQSEETFNITKLISKYKHDYYALYNNLGNFKLSSSQSNNLFRNKMLVENEDDSEFNFSEFLTKNSSTSFEDENLSNNIYSDLNLKIKSDLEKQYNNIQILLNKQIEKCKDNYIKYQININKNKRIILNENDKNVNKYVTIGAINVI